MSEPTITDVSDTALWVAVYRARETLRPDALFKDPLAARLAGEKGQQIEASMSGSKYTAWSVVIRTCIIDSYILDLVSRGEVDTIINLGAGLDTRPYRLNLPSNLRWVEVDFPQIIDLKEKGLMDEKPKCGLERVKLDLSNESLRQEFFERIGRETKKALILTEGVAPYLSEEQVASLGRALRQQESFVYWIVDYFNVELRRYLNTPARQKQMKNAPFVFFPEDWFGFFKKLGWKEHQAKYLMEEAKILNRGFPLGWFGRMVLKIFPGRAKKFSRRMGYILLAPDN